MDMAKLIGEWGCYLENHDWTEENVREFCNEHATGIEEWNYLMELLMDGMEE